MANEEIGNLKVSLALDDTQFNRPLASVERNLKGLGQELAIIRNKGKEWGDSLEGLRGKQEVLGRTLSTQETKVKKLREEYEKSVREKGADAAATENLANKLNRAVAEYTRTETELGQVNRRLAEQEEDLRRAESGWTRMETAMESASAGLAKAGEKMKGAGEKMTVGITTPLLGIGAAAIKVADEFDGAQGKLQAQLGLTAEEAEELGDVAQNLWENAFGDSLGEVGDSLAFIKQNMKDLNNGELEKVAESAYILKDAFDAEINETTRTASVLMKTFGIESKEAFDLMAVGFQRGGNFTDELLDTLREYAPQFQGLGYSAEEFTAILIAGAETGAFNLDKLGDAAKEAFLRIGDGSKSSRGALSDLGLNIKDIEKGIQAGGDEAKTSFAAVASAIAAVKDPAKKTQAAIALLGAPIEDLGPQFQDFFAKVDMDLGDFKGATEDAGAALYDNFGSRVTSVFRNFQSDLEPVGEILLDVAEEYLPKLADGISDLTEGFADMSPEAKETALKIAGVAAAAGPALVVVGTLTTGLSGLATMGAGLAGVLGGATGTGLIARLGLMGMAGPVGLAVAGVAGLAIGIHALTKASERSTEETIKAIDGKRAEIAKNDELIANYSDLRYQNQLSNEEMLRFLDVQALIDSTTTPDTIAALKEEQAKLLEKSTLTNDEMDNFLVLNQELIDASPNTVKAISSQGEAFALNTIAVRELNAEKAKEMENDAREMVTESLKREKGLLSEQKELIAGINEANEKQAEQKDAIREASQEIVAIESVIRDLEDQKAGASLDQIVQLDNQIRQQEELLRTENSKITEAERLLGTYGKQMDKKDEQLDAIRSEIAQSEAARHKYEEIILAQAGITSEKGRGLEKIGEELRKQDELKGKLKEQLKAGQINTAEYSEQNGKIDTQISKLNEARSELNLINDVAGKTIYKDVKINESPRNFWDTLDANLRRSVSKTVSIKYNARNGPQDVGRYAEGTGYHPGGLAIVGDGTGNNAGRELMQYPNGRTALSPATPTVMNLPKGTSVLSALNTKKLLGNVPQYANGTQDMRMGGLNPKALADAIVNAMTGQGRSGNTQPLEVTLQIPLDGRVIAEKTFKLTDELIQRNNNIQAIFQGGKTY